MSSCVDNASLTLATSIAVVSTTDIESSSVPLCSTELEVKNGLSFSYAPSLLSDNGRVAKKGLPKELHLVVMSSRVCCGEMSRWSKSASWE